MSLSAKYNLYPWYVQYNIRKSWILLILVGQGSIEKAKTIVLSAGCNTVFNKLQERGAAKTRLHGKTKLFLTQSIYESVICSVLCFSPSCAIVLYSDKSHT